MTIKEMNCFSGRDVSGKLQGGFKTEYRFILVCPSEEDAENQKEHYAVLYHKGKKSLPEIEADDTTVCILDFDLMPSKSMELIPGKIPLGRKIPLRHGTLLYGLMRSMEKEYVLRGRKKNHIIDAYGEFLFKRLHEEATKKEMEAHPSNEERLVLVRAMLQENPEKRWKIKELADCVFLSVSYFQHQYKEFFGKSVSEDIIENRIDLAKSMLETTRESVKMIAEKLHYRSDASFGRQFKTLVGMSPGRYKRQYGVKATKKKKDK